MKQALLFDVQKLRIEEVPKPKPAKNQVLVEVAVCGVCGSDLHIYKGDHTILRPPVVMGHEFVGRVAEIGDLVKDFSVGDYVAAIPGVGCGDCDNCKKGDFNLCRELKVIGGHFPGALAQFTLVPESNLIKVPEHFTPAEGAMIESVAVAVHAVKRMGEIKGKTFAVLGAGPIGLLTIQVLKALKASIVIASDPLERRRLLAQQAGADIVVDPIHDSLDQKVEQLSDLGIDGAFDCAGQEITLTQALTITRNGGKVVLTAIYGKNPTVPMRLLQRGERKLIGTQMYIKSDFKTAVTLMNDKKVKVLDLITHRFDLDQIVDAFNLAASHSSDVGKIVIEVMKY